MSTETNQPSQLLKLILAIGLLVVAWFIFFPPFGQLGNERAKLSKQLAAPIDTLQSRSWEPPIGIPAPDFGIKETHEMYVGARFAPGGFDYRDAGNGPYSHYVDNTAGNSTDSNNPYGTVTLPRRTIPANLPAGSVVEVHGGPYADTNSTRLTGVGSAAQPIFVRGANASQRPLYPGTVTVDGSYVIVENLYLNGSAAGFSVTATAAATNHHISFRHSEIVNSTSGSAVATAGYVNSATALVHHIVIYNNNIHDMGNWQAPSRWDRHCVGVWKNSRYIWVLDNELHHNQGDGVQVGWWGRLDQQVPPQYVYIGRNEIHHNHENALDFKCPQHVIVSDNKMYSIRAVADGADDGTAVVVHNDEWRADYPYPDNIWFLFNEVYDTEGGVRFNNIYDGGVANSRSYVVGNIFHNIFAVSAPLRQNNLWSPGAAIRVQNRAQVTAVNNVIYNTDLGIFGTATNSLLNTANNIISGLSGNYYALFGVQPIHLMVTGSAAASASEMSNNLLYNNGDQTPINWSGTLYNSISSFQAATGKGAGSVSQNPLFSNTANNDFSLLAGSPAIDAGVASGVYDTFSSLYGIDIKKDFNSNVRPQGTGWDIGAFEYTGTTPPSPICGNNVIEGTEQCDGSALGGQSCATQGFTGGTLTCTACVFNTSQCTNLPSIDTTPPTTPTNLTATAVSSSQINLAWTASTDSVGVTGYKIYRNGAQIATSPTNSYQDTGLSPSTAYPYTVSAFDAANNNSPQPASVNATTLPSSQTQTIYVDPQINVNNTTTYNVATRTIGSGNAIAYQTLQAAGNAVVAGDTVLIRGGNYSQALTPARSGTSEAPITFQNYNGEVATITGSSLNPALNLNGKSYIIIDGLKINNVAMWLNAEYANHNIIKNNHFSNSLQNWGGGVVFFFATHNKFISNVLEEGPPTGDSLTLLVSDNNLVQGNRIINAGHDLWSIKSGKFNVLRDNYFYNADQKIGEMCDAQLPGYGINRSNDTKYNLLENNIFTSTPGCYYEGTQGMPTDGIQLGAQNTIIRRNIFYDNRAGGIGFQIYSGENAFVNYNRIFHNVFYNNGLGGIYFFGNEGELVGNIIKNNIFYKNTATAYCNDNWRFNFARGEPIQIHIFNIPRDLNGFIQDQNLIENNNLSNNTAGERVVAYGDWGNVALVNNLSWWQSNYRNSFFNNVEDDPRFANLGNHDFSLTSGSPMIDKGVFLTKTMSSGSGTSMPVEDTGYFFDGFDITGEIGDSIQLAGQTQSARIIDIDYTNKVLRLDQTLSWTNNQGVSLSYVGSAPELGAYEYIAGGTPPAQTCGNNIVEGTEQCDGTNLNNQTCQTRGFTGGTLTCVACSLNTSQCTTTVPDTLPPVISSVTASGITATAAAITWTTNEPATTQVDYGFTTGYGQTSPLVSALTTAHTATLANLSPNSTYHYRVRSQDGAPTPNQAQSENFSFTTLLATPPDTTPPQAITDLKTTTIEPRSATLAFTSPYQDSTNSSSGSVASYDLRYSANPITETAWSTAAPASGEPTPATPGQTETYTLVDLTPEHTYYVAVKSQDSLNNFSALSNVVTLTTTAETPPPTTTTGGGGGGGGGGYAITPLNPPTFTTIRGANKQAILNWQNPVNPNFVRVLILRSVSPLPVITAPGNPRYLSQATIVYDSNTTSFTDINLTNGQLYYYTLYGYDRSGNYAQPVTVTVTPTINGTPDRQTLLLQLMRQLVQLLQQLLVLLQGRGS